MSSSSADRPAKGKAKAPTPPAKAMPRDAATASTGNEQTVNLVWQQFALRHPGTPGPAGARLHTDADAARAADSVGAAAVTVGHDVFFARGQYAPGTPRGDAVLRHEIAHVQQAAHDVPIVPGRRLAVAGLGHPAEREASHISIRGGRATVRARGPLAFRIPATPTPVARKTRDQIFGNPVGPIVGMTLGEFQDYTEQVQSDWFVEPTLSAADRASLWGLLFTLRKGGHIRLGVGDMKVADLVGVAAADWPSLESFCRGTDATQQTVRIFPPFAPAVADRVATGKALLDLEAIIPADQLSVTVSQSQLERLRTTAGLMALLKDYWTKFEPFLEETFLPVPAAVGPEFEFVLAFLTTILGSGLAPLLPLQGATAATRWVRNLHRFELPMLNQLVKNLGETAGARPLLLVLHTGHDAVATFRSARKPLSDLVMNAGSGSFAGFKWGPDNLVLMIEGPTTLADITARIPTITSTWGKLDAKGTRRINQVMIAGHGSGHSVSLAGVSAPTVSGGHVTYTQEALDSQGNVVNTTALLNALLKNMDPATARILYAGCLVGSRTIPAGTPAAGLAAGLAKDQSLGAFTENLATAAGVPVTPGVTVQAARASVGIGGITSFEDTSGNLSPTYPMDPNAFGSAASYVPTGLEPEGLLRAAVEVGVTTSAAVAESMLRTRMGLPAKPTDWWDTITRLMVSVVLPAPKTPLDLHLVNEAANVAEVPFLIQWSKFGWIDLIQWSKFGWIDAAAYVTRLNPQPFAAAVYAGLAATKSYTTPGTGDEKRLRVIVDEGQFIQSGLAATLLSGIGATKLDATSIENFLDVTPAVLGGHEKTLMAPAGALAAEQLRLALAWFALDPKNADIRAFLSSQVTTAVGAAPSFNAAAAKEIKDAGQNDRTILKSLGFALTATGAPSKLGATPPPLANVHVPGSTKNTVFVSPDARTVTVIASVVNIRYGPSKAFGAFDVAKKGETFNIAGESGDWIAVDKNGKLGFIHKTLLI